MILSLCQFRCSFCSLLGLCNFIMNTHVFWLFSHASGTCWTSSVLKMSYLEIASFQNHSWMMWRKRWKPLLELLPFILLLCKDPVPGIHQSMTWVVWCLACGVRKVDSTCWSSGEFIPLVFSFQSWTLFDANSRAPSGFWCNCPFYRTCPFHPKIIPHSQSPPQSPIPSFVRHQQKWGLGQRLCQWYWLRASLQWCWCFADYFWRALAKDRGAVNWMDFTSRCSCLSEPWTIWFGRIPLQRCSDWGGHHASACRSQWWPLDMGFSFEESDS